MMMTTETRVAIEGKAQAGAETLSLSVLDMPLEIIERIVASLDHPRDLWVLYRALGVVPPTHVRATAVLWGAQRMHLLLAAGAPLDVVVDALAIRKGPLCKSIIIHAVAGGQFDVVSRIMDCYKVKKADNRGVGGLRRGRFMHVVSLLFLFGASRAQAHRRGEEEKLTDSCVCVCVYFYCSVINASTIASAGCAGSTSVQRRGLG
jgi:hypothetical protein